MPLPSRRLALVRAAIGIVLRRLAALVPSPQVVELRARAADILREADDWQDVRPTPEGVENVMKRVLGLHVAVAKLERLTPP